MMKNPVLETMLPTRVPGFRQGAIRSSSRRIRWPGTHNSTMSAAPAVHSARSEIVCSRPVQRLPARSSTVISDCQASGCPVSMRTSYPCAPMTPASTCPRAPPPQIQNVYGFVGSFRSSGIRSKSIAFIVFWFCTVSAMKAPCGSVSAPKMRMNGFIADFRSDYAAQPEISGRQPVMYVVVCLTNFPPPRVSSAAWCGASARSSRSYMRLAKQTSCRPRPML